MGLDDRPNESAHLSCCQLKVKGAAVRTLQRREEEEEEMGAITSAVIAIVGVVLGWITIEIACKPCLEQGRAAIDRNLNPDYDPDDDVASSSDIRAPLNPPTPTNTNTTTADVEVEEDPKASAAAAAAVTSTPSHSDALKAV